MKWTHKIIFDAHVINSFYKLTWWNQNFRSSHFASVGAKPLFGKKQPSVVGLHTIIPCHSPQNTSWIFKCNVRLECNKG